MANYIQIGYTQKTHGVKGELKVFIEEPFWDLWQIKERVFLDVKGIKVPYFIVTVRGSFEDIVQFEDVPNREAALMLQSRKMYLLDTDLPKGVPVATETMQYAYLKGFSITDAHLGPIGAIEAVLEMPQQEMALLHINKKEVLIPLNKHFIERIDKEKKSIWMNLPDGLLDV